jgi:hypothetical protein
MIPYPVHLAQSGGMFDNIIWLVIFMVFMLFYPRLMITQMIWKLEQSAVRMENRSKKTKKTVMKKISKRPDLKLRSSVANFLETVPIMPKNLDPYGVVPKIDHIIKQYRRRFKYFVGEVAPKMDEEEKANLIGGLSGAITMNQIAKVVRHWVELVRKTKNLQLAMVLQMQLPMIERIAKAVVDGTEALTNGWPVGDGAGPMVASLLIGKSKITKKYKEEEMILVKKRINGKKVIIMRAKGPGGRIGDLGDAVVDVVKKNKIAKIITVDAAAKLEGERTGSIADAVGVAIGGVGVDSFVIENIAVKKKIPLDAYAIKMSQEEAIQPMLGPIALGAKNVVKRVEDNIKKTKEKGSILVVGVGNGSGIGNNATAVKEAEKTVKKVQRIMDERKKKEKKSLLNRLVGG